jgi:hypothetical protein
MSLPGCQPLHHVHMAEWVEEADEHRARIALDPHLTPGSAEGRDDLRDQRHAPFFRPRFFGDSDAHTVPFLCELF